MLIETLLPDRCAAAVLPRERTAGRHGPRITATRAADKSANAGLDVPAVGRPRPPTALNPTAARHSLRARTHGLMTAQGSAIRSGHPTMHAKALQVIY
ncbi:hypothetical protein ADL21_07585 [Streptomyces albus subsp. albus]|nr:hypothetical protein ADL21_07585 [Streptomyces albus subsp. albus]